MFYISILADWQNVEFLDFCKKSTNPWVTFLACISIEWAGWALYDGSNFRLIWNIASQPTPYESERYIIIIALIHLLQWYVLYLQCGKSRNYCSCIGTLYKYIKFVKCIESIGTTERSLNVVVVNLDFGMYSFSTKDDISY